MEYNDIIERPHFYRTSVKNMDTYAACQTAEKNTLQARSLDAHLLPYCLCYECTLKFNPTGTGSSRCVEYFSQTTITNRMLRAYQQVVTKATADQVVSTACVYMQTMSKLCSRLILARSTIEILTGVYMRVLQRSMQILFVFAVSAAFTAHADSWNCSSTDLVREVVIEYLDPAGAPVPCHVIYKKHTEGFEDQVLWSAENLEGYCEEKAKDLVAKLESWGWVCLETVSAESAAENDADAESIPDAGAESGTDMPE